MLATIVNCDIPAYLRASAEYMRDVGWWRPGLALRPGQRYHGVDPLIAWGDLARFNHPHDPHLVDVIVRDCAQTLCEVLGIDVDFRRTYEPYCQAVVDWNDAFISGRRVIAELDFAATLVTSSLLSKGAN